MNLNSLTIRDNRTGKEVDFPIVTGTEGSSVVDIEKFYKEFGMFTLDSCYRSTASCKSKITFIDGESGVLLYRGYAIEDLIEFSHYPEVCYLLLEGELPNKKQYAKFVNTLTEHAMLHEQILNFFKGYRRDAHPMAVMVGVVGALSAFYHDALDVNNPPHWEISAFRLIAKIPTIAAASYKYSVGQPFVYPDNGKSFVENFLYMMFSVPGAKFKMSPVLIRAMESILILYADHEQNAATATVRLASSSQANPFAAVSAGIGALWGKKSGGTNEAVLNMLHEIQTLDRIPEYIKRAKDPKDPFRLLGFGHPVYKNYDPRARIMKKLAHDVFAELGLGNDPLFRLALELEKIAQEDDYFVNKKLYPNMNFYTGLIQTAIGIPKNMFIVVFVVARIVGWISQWKEMIEANEGIGRPRQLYIGACRRDYRFMNER